MRTMLVVPESYELEELGENVTIVSVPPDRAVAFDFLPPHGTFLVMPQPESVRDIPSLIEEACALTQKHRAIAFLPEGEPQRNVLATAAAAYAFDALTLHLAGGLDSTIPIAEMCLDAMIRLAGRGAQPISVGHSSILSLPSLAVDSYLKVAARNFTPDTQARYLAPVFLATVTAPMQASDTNTHVLDLERTPYTPSHELSTRELPEGSNDGVHTLHEWFSELNNNAIANDVLKPFRRRPDALLPNVSDFFAEAVRATGIEESTADTLVKAFADSAENRAPRVLFVPSANAQARARMDSIRACLPYKVSYYDTETHTVYASSSPESQWLETGDSQIHNHPIVYLIDTQLRALPWLNMSEAIVIVDFTGTDIVEMLRHDVPMETASAPSPGHRATLLNETVARADRLIACDNTQRDFLLGTAAGLRRLNQYTYDEDLSLSSLVDMEEGTRAACAAIDTCLHPFDTVTNNPEYEATIFDAAVPPPPPPPPTLSQRVVNKAKRTIFGGEPQA